MANPTHEGLAVLKRIGMYLEAHNRLIRRIEWCGLHSELHGYADSDWAGDKNQLQVDERTSIDVVPARSLAFACAFAFALAYVVHVLGTVSLKSFTIHVLFVFR